MQPLDLAEVAKQLAVLVRRFNKSFELQSRQDAATVASLNRVLRNPRGVARVEVDTFKQLIRQIIIEETADAFDRDGQQGRPTEA